MLDLLLERADLYLMVFLRTSGVFVAAPIFGNRYLPNQLKIVLALGTALILFPVVPVQTLPLTLPGLIPLGIGELLIGLIIGYISSLIFAAVQLGGQLLDTEMGFGIVNVLDPQSGLQLPLMGNFQYLLALLIFLVTNGHHLLLLALSDSYAAIPIGGLRLGPGLTGVVIDLFAQLFVVALKISAPAMVALFLTSVALGVIARAVPQMNVFVVGIPIKLITGILVLMVGLPLYLAALERFFDGVYGDIFRVMRLLGGQGG